MCGRFSITLSLDMIVERFGCQPADFQFAPRYNVAPTQQVPVVVKREGLKQLQVMRWGLVPFWSKEPSIGSRLINARLETIREKPAFKNALPRRRCIVPADGYFEWLKTAQGKTPMRIVQESGDCFGMAGLWDAWEDEQGNCLTTFTIITTEPVEPIRYIHNRMPLVLTREAEKVWLDGPAQPGPTGWTEFLASLRCEAGLEAYQISNLVNSPIHDVPEVIEKVSPNTNS
ncbi:MAG: SOS response-associated peptidase [Ignavibacteriales bacterium]